VGTGIENQRRIERVLARECRLLRKSTGPQIVLRLLEIAVDIDKRQRSWRPSEFRERCSMPEVMHTIEELSEARAQRLKDIDDGDDPRKVFGIHDRPSGAELDLLESINTVCRDALRQCRCGRGAACGYQCGRGDPDRDYEILWLLAEGRTQENVAEKIRDKMHAAQTFSGSAPSDLRSHARGMDDPGLSLERPTDRAKKVKFSQERVAAIKRKSLATIWNAIAHLAPLPTKRAKPPTLREAEFRQAA
jgi:hypothetical protein